MNKKKNLKKKKRKRQEGLEFKASLGYIVRTCLKKPKLGM
jgi:hypothetical protein